MQMQTRTRTRTTRRFVATFLVVRYTYSGDVVIFMKTLGNTLRRNILRSSRPRRDEGKQRPVEILDDRSFRKLNPENRTVPKRIESNNTDKR